MSSYRINVPNELIAASKTDYYYILGDRKGIVNYWKYDSAGDGEWVFGQGQAKLPNDPVLYTSYHFPDGDDDKPVPNGILVRLWKDDTWHKPTHAYIDGEA